MLGKAFTMNKLNKSDYYDIVLIVIFSLYAYFFMGQIFTAGDADQVNGIKILIFSFSTFVVPLVVLAWILYRFWSKNSKSDSKLGFTLDKAFWIQFGIVFLIGIISFSDHKIQIPTLDTMIYMSSFILNVATAEIVIRAILIGVVIKVVGSNKLGIILAVVLSGLLFMTVSISYYPFDLITMIGFMGVASIFIGTRNLLFVIFWDVIMLMPKIDCSLEGIALERAMNDVTKGLSESFIIIFLILYFALAVPIHFMQKRKSKDNILTSQT